jgi:hypothetical protein
MDGVPEIKAGVAIILGLLMQNARAYKGLNNWLVWVGVAVASIVFWIWATPDALHAFQSNWRTAAWSIVMFAAAAGGFGKFSKDAKAAPAADTK